VRRGTECVKDRPVMQMPHSQAILTPYSYLVLARDKERSIGTGQKRWTDAVANRKNLKSEKFSLFLLDTLGSRVGI
jgi:hypothetical protein